jgi:two-component system phosphate regulon sensor histidine kinase PhoR
MAGSGARITVIAVGGRVLIDSEEEASRMENHADRPEVRQSLAEGTGRAARYSTTLRRDLVYLAVRREMENGEAVILRFALPLARINEAISAVRDRVATAMLVVMLLGTVLTLVFTRSFASRVER